MSTVYEAIGAIDSAEFEAAARPLIEWVNNNGIPHTKVIVTNMRAEVLDGVAMVEVLDYLRD